MEGGEYDEIDNENDAASGEAKKLFIIATAAALRSACEIAK